MTEVDDHILTAVQCKVARAVLGWEMHDLAGRASVSVNTIADLENRREMPIPAKLAALRQAFSSNGQCTLRFAKSGGFGWLDFEDGRPLLIRRQCRAARALLDWDINDLAQRARVVSVNTIERFENGQSRPIRATQKAPSPSLRRRWRAFYGRAGAAPLVPNTMGCLDHGRISGVKERVARLDQGYGTADICTL